MKFFVRNYPVYAFTSCQMLVKCFLNFPTSVIAKSRQMYLFADVRSLRNSVIVYTYRLYVQRSLIELWNCRSDYVKAHFLLERSRIEKRGKERVSRLVKKHSRHRGGDTRLFMDTLLEVSIYLSLRIKASNHFFKPVVRGLHSFHCTLSVASSSPATSTGNYPCDVFSDFHEFYDQYFPIRI